DGAFEIGLHGVANGVKLNADGANHFRHASSERSFCGESCSDGCTDEFAAIHERSPRRLVTVRFRKRTLHEQRNNGASIPLKILSGQAKKGRRMEKSAPPRGGQGEIRIGSGGRTAYGGRGERRWRAGSSKSRCNWHQRL